MDRTRPILVRECRARSVRMTLLGMAACGLLGTPAARGGEDDPVFQRYEKKVVPSKVIRFDTAAQRVALTAPATPQDVAAGKAVFTLAGLGEARVWQLPRCPLPATWTTLKQFPRKDDQGVETYANWGHVIQAEELLVDGKWRRYFGLITAHGVAVVPGAEIDLILSSDFEIGWVGLRDSLDWGVKSGASEHEFGTLAVGDPLPLEALVRNRAGVARRLPTDFQHGPDQGGPAWREGVRLVVKRAPFKPGTAEAGDPPAEAYRPLEPKHRQTFVANDPGHLLETGEVVRVFAGDLRDEFDLSEPGYYHVSFEFDKLKPSKGEIHGCSGYSFTFTLGNPPPRLTTAELNRTIPPLGGAAAEARIRKLIAETCKPKPAPAAGLEPAWSEAGGGVRARIVYVGQGGYTGYVVMVGLRNVSSNTLVVPMGHPAGPRKKAGFHLQLRRGADDWKTLDGFGEYRLSEIECLRDEKMVETKPPPARVALAPGQEALVYLSGEPDAALAEAAEVRIMLDQPTATAPRGGWHGRVTTPPAPARWDEKMLDGLAGRLPFPTFFPEFSKLQFMGGNMSGGESAVVRLGITNRDLLAALPMFEPGGVRREMERRMAAARDTPLKLLLAMVAADAGSQPAALCVLDALRETDFDTAENVHDVLGQLMDRRDDHPPEWLVAMVMAAVSDERYATGMEHTNRGEDTRMVLAEMADKLVMDLGSSKCLKALPFLIERVRKDNSRHAIMALGAMGDPQAVPVLLEVVRQTGKSAEYGSGFGLSPESFARAVEELATLKAVEAVPALLEFPEFPEVIEALERLGDRRAVPVLRAVMEAKGAVVRDGKNLWPKAAAERLAKAKLALATLEKGDAIPRLCALFADPTFGEFDRRAVIWRLGDRADPRAIPLLLTAIKTDPSGAVVNQAITVMSAFKFKAAVAGLIDCFDADFKGKADWKRAYEPGMYRENIAESLRTITGRHLGADKQQWQDWWQHEGRLDPGLK